jgi:ubiquinone/menaquinone biosynthesis C-methylase UbiE
MNRIEDARRRVRTALPVEADLAFRRRCETVIEFLDAGPDSVVLDCGCGYGYYLDLVNHLTGASITGIDPDLSRIAEISERFGNRPGISAVQGDGTALPFADASFTHAISSEVIEHVSDDLAVVRELHRVLTPGGTAVLTVPAQQYPAAWDPINFILERLAGRHIGGERLFSGIWYGHRRLYEASDLRKVVEQAGFNVVGERSLTHRCLPFSHLVFYGILKPLYMSKRAPRWLTGGSGRLAGSGQSPSPPLRLAMRALEWIDQANDKNAGKTRFVAHAIVARKPGVQQ